MTKSDPALKTETADDLARSAGGALMTLIRAIAKLIATIWRIAGALDSALWHGVKHFFFVLAGFLGAVSKAIWRGCQDFAGWLPTRPGRAYSAISGIVLIISGLWIADELVLRAENYAQTGGERPKPPVDTEDPILARMGGRYIRLSDVSIAASTAGQLREGEILSPETAFSRGLVESFVEQRLLAQAAIGEGMLRQTPVASRLNIARDRILAASYLDERIKKAVTSEVVEAFYRSQASVTQLGDEVEARHIVVALQGEAVSVLQALAAGGDFAALARELSVDRATAPLGGQIGYFTRDMVTPTLAQAAFSTEPGNIAPLFETEFGWHVLEVTDRRPTEGIAFDQVKDNIERFLTMRTIERSIQELAENENVTYFRVEPEQTLLEAPDPAALTGG